MLAKHCIFANGPCAAQHAGQYELKYPYSEYNASEVSGEPPRRPHERSGARVDERDPERGDPAGCIARMAHNVVRACGDKGVVLAQAELVREMASHDAMTPQAPQAAHEDEDYSEYEVSVWHHIRKLSGVN
jgi:hypothetical protein